MKLNVFERINLSSILPRRETFLSLKIIRQLREDLSFTEKEHKVLKFKQVWFCPECQKVREVEEGDKDTPRCLDCKEVCSHCGEKLDRKVMRNTGKVTWDRKAAREKDIKMGNKARSIIRNTLEELNENAKKKEKGVPWLGDEHFTLYEKFCEDEK